MAKEGLLGTLAVILHADVAGSTALVQKDEHVAHERIQDSMRLDPYHPSSYLVTLGAARFGMGNYGEAAASFERVIKRNPDNELARIYLAASYAHLGRIDDGEAMIEATNNLRDFR